MPNRLQHREFFESDPIRSATSERDLTEDPQDAQSYDSRADAPDQSNGDGIDHLYRAHFDQLVRLSRIRIGHVLDAEDLVQDAFVAVKRAYPHRSIHDLRPLLFATLRNMTVNYLKSGHARQRRASSEIGEMQDQIACGRGVTPERQLMDTQMLAVANAVIAGLPKRRREALRLHRYEGLTYDQIARRLSVSTRTAKTDVAEALAAIAEGLARAG